VLKEKQAKPAKWKWKPLVVQAAVLTAPFKNAGWDKIRNENLSWPRRMIAIDHQTC
jgi:hypothetical protein